MAFFGTALTLGIAFTLHAPGPLSGWGGLLKGGPVGALAGWLELALPDAPLSLHGFRGFDGPGGPGMAFVRKGILGVLGRRVSHSSEVLSWRHLLRLERQTLQSVKPFCIAWRAVFVCTAFVMCVSHNT